MDAATRLSDWPWVDVRVDCKLCPRNGRYRLARLAARFGAEMELDRLLAILARDCPYWRSDPRKYEVRCGVRYRNMDHAKPKLETPEPSRRYQPMGTTRTMTLADLTGPTVVVVCAPCGRRGVYRLASLVERFGLELPLPSVLFRLAVGCAGLRESTPRCRAVYAGLGAEQGSRAAVLGAAVLSE